MLLKYETKTKTKTKTKNSVGFIKKKYNFLIIVMMILVF